VFLKHSDNGLNFDFMYHFHMKMSLLFSNVTLFSLPEVFCGPQICQKCAGGRGSATDLAGGAHDAPSDLLVGWGWGQLRQGKIDVEIEKVISKLQ